MDEELGTESLDDGRRGARPPIRRAVGEQRRVLHVLEAQADDEPSPGVAAERRAPSMTLASSVMRWVPTVTTSLAVDLQLALDEVHGG